MFSLKSHFGLQDDKATTRSRAQRKLAKHAEVTPFINDPYVLPLTETFDRRLKKVADEARLPLVNASDVNSPRLRAFTASQLWGA